MFRFYLKDYGIQKRIYVILFLVLIIVSSTTNTLLVYFYQRVNMDFEKNQYYNIYSVTVSSLSSTEYQHFLGTIQDEFELRGHFRVGTIHIDKENYCCAAFSYEKGSEDIRKYYHANTGKQAENKLVIADYNVKESSLNYFKGCDIEFSNLIYGGDMLEHISFVCSQQDYEKFNVDTYKVSFEVKKHLDLWQRLKLKKILDKEFGSYKLDYQKPISKNAMNAVKDVFIMTILLIIYTFISVMGIYDYIIRRKKKILRIYMINGMSKQRLIKMFLVENLLVDTVVFLFSVFITRFTCSNLHYYESGALGWLPYFITLSMVLISSTGTSVYNANIIYKEDAMVYRKD